MMFPNCLRACLKATAFLGMILSQTAFASAHIAVAPSKAIKDLPPYMITAAGLENIDYMDCVRNHVKSPADKNIVGNVNVALNCQGSKN